MRDNPEGSDVFLYRRLIVVVQHSTESWDKMTRQIPRGVRLTGRLLLTLL